MLGAGDVSAGDASAGDASAGICEPINHSGRVNIQQSGLNNPGSLEGGKYISHIDSVNNSLKGVPCPPQSYVGFYGQDLKLNNLITYKQGQHANPTDPPSNLLYKKTALDNFVHCNHDNFENYFNSAIENPVFPDVFQHVIFHQINLK